MKVDRDGECIPCEDYLAVDKEVDPTKCVQPQCTINETITKEGTCEPCKSYSIPVEGEQLDNEVFKMMLLNNNEFFSSASDSSFMAFKPESDGMEFRLLSVSGEPDTYYLQDANSDEYVSWQSGGWHLRMKNDGADGYQKLPIKFFPNGSGTYDILDAISGH